MSTTTLPSREAIEKAMRAERGAENIAKMGGNAQSAEQTRREQWPGSEDLDDERTPVAGVHVTPGAELHDGEPELTDHERGLLAVHDARRTVAKAEGLSDGERAEADSALRALQARHERGAAGAEDDDDSDRGELTKSEASLLDLWQTRERLRNGGARDDDGKAQTFSTDAELTDALRKLGHERAMRTSDGYRRVQEVRAAGGSLS